MTINRRIRIIPEVLISCVLATGSLVFWSSLTVECGIRGAKAAWEASQSAYMMTILFEQRMLTGDKRSLKQWEKHCELLGSIIDQMDSESVDPKLLKELRNRFQAVQHLAPRLRELALTKDDDRQVMREKAIL